MTSASFLKIATEQATTKRPPDISSGKRGAPAANITAPFYCTPLDPVTSDMVTTEVIEAPEELLQTFCDGSLDIVEGDVLVIGSDEYPIKFVDDWDWMGEFMRRLFVGQRKQVT